MLGLLHPLADNLLYHTKIVIVQQVNPHLSGRCSSPLRVLLSNPLRKAYLNSLIDFLYR